VKVGDIVRIKIGTIKRFSSCPHEYGFHAATLFDVKNEDVLVLVIGLYGDFCRVLWDHEIVWIKREKIC
jgi:hypothetical protein